MAERLVDDQQEQQLDQESCCSDSGSIAYEPMSKKSDEVSSSSEMVRLKEESEEYVLLKHRFYLSIGSGLSQDCRVVEAYRDPHTSPMKRAHIQAFRIFKDAMAAKRGGNPNVAHAWYGASKEEARRIVKDGFGACGVARDGVPCGFGLHLWPELSARQSVLSAPVDGDGLRHVVVCRVILGSTETIVPGSTQSAPSSGDFDSGVDNQQAPSKYIIWYPDVKTNVLPMYALSVKLDIQSRAMARVPAREPTSPWMPFTALVYALNKYLPHPTYLLVRRLHTDFLERKMSRQQFIRSVRRVSGDKLLVAAIRDFQEKRMGGKLRKTNM